MDLQITGELWSCGPARRTRGKPPLQVATDPLTADGASRQLAGMILGTDRRMGSFFKVSS